MPVQTLQFLSSFDGEISCPPWAERDGHRKSHKTHTLPKFFIFAFAFQHVLADHTFVLNNLVITNQKFLAELDEASLAKAGTILAGEIIPARYDEVSTNLLRSAAKQKQHFRPHRGALKKELEPAL